MTRKTTLIILSCIMLAVLLGAIAFGLAVTCIPEQQPIAVLDISLSNAIKRGVAEDYDYFARKDMGLYKYNENINFEKTYLGIKLIYLSDEGMGGNIQIDFWYTKYMMRTPLEAMTSIEDVEMVKLEITENGDIWTPNIKVKPATVEYSLYTFGHEGYGSHVYLDCYYVIRATQEIIEKVSSWNRNY